MPSVDTIIADAAEYAQDLLDDAQRLVEDAQTAAQGYVQFSPRQLGSGAYDLDEFDYDAIIADGDPGDFASREAQFDAFSGELDDRTDPLDSQYMTPALPTLPIFNDAPAELDVSVLFNIDRPTWDVDAFDEAAPTVGAIALPESPELIFPDDPESATGLTAPEITAPTFDQEFGGTAPTPLTALSDDFKVDYAAMSPTMIANLTEHAEGWVLKYCPEYFTALGQLETVMREDITNGTALADDVEQRIFDRSRTRALAEGHAMQRTVSDTLSKRGFVLPPGAMQGGFSQAQMAASQAVSRAAAEVAIERAKFELQHKQFCMGLSMNLRQTVINNAIAYLGGLVSINGQALDYARQVGAMSSEVFNQRLQLFNAQLELYRAEAAVYETKLESAFAQLKVFEAQIAAEKLKAEVDQTRVALYQAKLEAQMTRVRTYTAQLEGVQSLVAMERLNVEIFESKVRAYAARVSAKQAEFGAYSAAIEGDLGKVRAYASTIDAYQATIQAEGVKADVERTHAGIITDWNKHLNDRYEMNLRRYETQVRGEAARIGSDIDVYKAAMSSYLGKLDAKIKVRVSDLNAAELDLKERTVQFDGDVRTMLTSGTLSQERIKANAEIAIAGAKVLEGLGTAALSVNNAIVSYNESV